jgi:hypothetical protein
MGVTPLNGTMTHFLPFEKESGYSATGARTFFLHFAADRGIGLLSGLEKNSRSSPMIAAAMILIRPSGSSCGPDRTPPNQV